MNPKVITETQVASLLPTRPNDSHKGQFGSVSIIGGASGMIGAAILAARAALKMGAGCVHVYLLAKNAPSIDLAQPELMIHNAAEGMLENHITHACDVWLAGCGMGTDGDAQELLKKCLLHSGALVLDADALNLIAQHPAFQAQLITRKYPTVLTPHPGEAARLLNCSTTDIQNNRTAAARQLARHFSCSVVLKGAHSLCVAMDGSLFINLTGNAGMSAPGMGDVLAGMVAAFIAQGLSPDDALRLAVYLHGAAGDQLAQKTTLGMTASELTGAARERLHLWLSTRDA